MAKESTFSIVWKYFLLQECASWKRWYYCVLPLNHLTKFLSPNIAVKNVVSQLNTRKSCNNDRQYILRGDRVEHITKYDCMFPPDKLIPAKFFNVCKSYNQEKNSNSKQYSWCFWPVKFSSCDARYHQSVIGNPMQQHDSTTKNHKTLIYDNPPSPDKSRHENIEIFEWIRAISFSFYKIHLRENIDQTQEDRNEWK